MMDRDPPWRGKDRPKRHGNKWWGGKHTIWQENPLTHWVFGHKWTQKMKGLLDNSWPKFTRKRIHLNRVLSLHFRCVKYRTSQSALASWVRRRNAVHLHTHPASYLKYHTWKTHQIPNQLNLDSPPYLAAKTLATWTTRPHPWYPCHLAAFWVSNCPASLLAHNLTEKWLNPRLCRERLQDRSKTIHHSVKKCHRLYTLYI